MISISLVSKFPILIVLEDIQLFQYDLNYVFSYVLLWLLMQVNITTIVSIDLKNKNLWLQMSVFLLLGHKLIEVLILIPLLYKILIFHDSYV